MPEIHLGQLGFTYSACGPLRKIKERVQKFKETGDSRYIYQNDYTYFQHNMAYGVFKDLIRRTVSDKIWNDEAFNIAKNPKYDGYQRGLSSMTYNFFDKKSALLADKSASGDAAKNKIMSNKELVERISQTIR